MIETIKGYNLGKIASRGSMGTKYGYYVDGKHIKGKDKQKIPARVVKEEDCSCWILERISYDKPLYRCPICKKKVMLPVKKSKRSRKAKT